jgi:hypothetical protein
MNKQDFILPILFRQYFIANFNLKTFRNNNEHIIRDYALDKYIETTQDKILSKDIKTMFKTNEYGKDIVIDEDFPYDKLVKIMKPYLNLYLYSVYSLNGEKRITSSIKLNKKLKKFVNFNTKFGRKEMMRTTEMYKVSYTYKFIDEHLEYISDDCESFDKSHIYDFSNDSDNESDDTFFSDHEDEDTTHTFNFTNNNIDNNDIEHQEEESNSSQTEYTFTEPSDSSESYDAEYNGYVNEIVNFMSEYQ